MQIDIGQLEFIDKTLRDIVTWLETLTGLTFTVTSLYRPGDPGVHGQIPLRGIDLRFRHGFELGKDVCSLINDHWVYDPGRPHLVCAMIHDTGAGLHLHVQVHPNTVKV